MLEWILALIFFVAFIVTWLRLRELRRVFQAELSRRVAEIQLQLAQEAAAKLEAERQRLERMFEEWKQKEMGNAVQVELEKWRQEMEREIRRDAIKSSITTLLGKVSEQIAPLFMIMKLGLDPRDLRFIGSPVDYIAFKGLSNGSPEKVLFIEVKASQSGALTDRERLVKSLIDNKRVEWVTFNIRSEVEKAFERAEDILVGADHKLMTSEADGKPLERTNTAGRHHDLDFYEWLAREFQLSREDFDKLTDDTKALLKREYDSSRRV